MRWLGRAFPILAAAMAVALTPASAIAATVTTYSDPISGFEYTAASNTRQLRRRRLGAVPGPWSATVDHTPLGTSATITGGEFSLATYRDGTLTTITGHFTAGTIQQLSGFTGCVNQRYAVNGLLGGVGFRASRQRHWHLRRHADALPDEDLRILRDIFREHQRITFAGPVLTPR